MLWKSLGCCWAPRDDEKHGVEEPRHLNSSSNKPTWASASPTSSLPTSPSQAGYNNGDVGLALSHRPHVHYARHREDDPHSQHHPHHHHHPPHALPLGGTSGTPSNWLTVLAALASAVTGFILAAGESWTLKAGALCLAITLLAAATTQQPQPRFGPNSDFDPADAAQLAEEAREVRDRTWQDLGIEGAEAAKVKELMLRLGCSPGAGLPERQPSSRWSKTRRPATSGPTGSEVTDTDFVTAWRFLRAKRWSLRAAEEAIRSAVSRQDSMQEFDPALLRSCKQLTKHWRGQGFAGVDVDGDPVLWERPGLLDWQGFSMLEEELLVCCEMLCLQRMNMELDRRTVEEQRPVHRLGVVVDLEGLSMSFARSRNLSLFRRLVSLSSALQPERLKWVLLVNPPRKFMAVWKLILPYFGPGTQQKFRIAGPHETQAVLQRYVPHEHVARFLGGPSRQANFTGAGKIPRRLLRELEGFSKPKQQVPPEASNVEEKAAPAASSSKPISRVVHAASAAAVSGGRQLALGKWPRGLRFGSSSTDFKAKQASLPRTEWKGPGGPLPPPHSWGSLSDPALFPAPYRTATRQNRWPKKAGFTEVLDVDIFKSSEDDPVLQAYEHPGLAPQYYRQRGESRFLLVMNFIVGPYQHVVVAACQPPQEGSDPDVAAQWQLWNRFLAQPESAKGRALRVAAACFEGPVFVQEILKSQKATHLGRFLPSFTRGENHLEVTVHLATSEMRRLRVVFQHSYHLIVNGLAYYLDGPVSSQDCFLFGHYCSFIDVKRLRQV